LNAGWDSALLRVELADLGEAGVDLGLIGFSVAELGDLLVTRKPDDAAPPGEFPE
jgi:hypothetical protein